MNFVSYSEMVTHCSDLAMKLPKFDMVCGIPRSGMLPASILALHWNVPLTTPSALIQGKHIGGGERLENGQIKNVLIVDDSVFKGGAMSDVKALLKDVTLEKKYLALYGANDESLKHVDYCYMKVGQPRLFEWNWKHHEAMMRITCTDMDGVLCRPPTREENDYGPKYEEFLKNTEPWHIPTVAIGCIITGRLEKYRTQTEEWLRRNKVIYNELIMRQDKSEVIPEHKARNIMKLKPNLFVEDEPYQAKVINTLTKVPVLCTTEWRLYR